MRSTVVASLLFGAVAFVPSTSVWAQADQPPDRMPAEQAAPADQPAALGACGSPSTVLVDRSTIGVVPGAQVDAQGEDNKDGMGAVNLMSVRGTIVHAEGDLMLLKLPENVPAPNTNRQSGNALAVVRLPEECPAGMRPECSGVMAIGTPAADGILEAQSIQPAE
jgi:hypothetical protein